MAEAVTLDTSGEIIVVGGSERNGRRTTWRDLDPFTQGYIEALFASIERTTANLVWDADDHARFARYSDLAPETLAAILKDCEAYQVAGPLPRQWGEHFWKSRQNCFEASQRPTRVAMHAKYPPLTPYLGDDGRVYLREAA